MKKAYIHKQFWKYVLPSMFAMLLSGFYAIVDGLFVGNAVGNDALAAINLVWPMQALLNAIAVGIGVGSAVVMSVYLGENKQEKANHAAGLGALLLLIAGIVFPILLMVCEPLLLDFLGAEGTLRTYAHEYIMIVLLGGLFPMLGNGLNPLIRNHGKTITATFLMSIGLITNILLDYLFVFQYGMGLYGAGLATIIAQFFVVIGSICYLWISRRDVFQRCNYRLDAGIIKQTLAIGISPFGQTLVPSIVIILTNWQCIRYGGNDAVTVYSVVSYVVSSVQMLLQGIGDGVQPLLSFYYGSKKQKELQLLYRKSSMLSLAVALFIALFVALYQTRITALFGISEGLLEMCGVAVMISAISFPFLGIARLTTAYFYATGKPKSSSFLVYIEPCFFLPASLLLLSYLFQLDGIWLSYPIAQFLLCLCSLLLKYPEKLKQKTNEVVLQKS